MTRVVVAAVAVFSFAACNNGSSNNDAGHTDSGVDSGVDAGPGNDAGMSCATYATANCTFVQACEPGQMQSLYGTVANCQTVLTAQCQANLDAPSSNYNAAWLTACAAQLTTNGQGCASGPKPLPVPSATDACALTGNGAAGASCGIDSQCQSDSCNRNGTLCGACNSVGALGAACGPGTGVNCQRGLFCGNKAVCATIVGVGSSCDLGVTTECVAGSACVIASADAGTGSCMVSGAQASATCNPLSIGQARCSDVAGFACNAATSTCQPITYAAAGSPCGPSDGGASSPTVQCADGQCVNGTCVVRAAAQAGCTVGVANSCVEGNLCVADPAGLAGTCTPTDVSCVTRDAGYPNFEFAPSNVSLAQVFSQVGMAQDENLSSSCTIHTDAISPDALCLNSPISAITQEDGTTVNLIVVNSLSIQSGGTLNVVGGPAGGNGSGVPLIIVSLSNITVEGGGNIVASSSSANNTNGPGGGVGQTTNSAGVPAPGGGAAPTMSGTKGGGGGSFCGIGGPGGGSAAVSMVYGSRDLRPLVAGSSGGQGWYAGYGSGGGGLQLVAAGTIEVKAGGVITAAGGGGIGASGPATSTTGGGSGGAILIEAANLVIAGTVAANGGGGGGGDSNSFGTDGTPNATAAPGQPGVAGQGSTGGAGSASANLAGAAGTIDAGTYGGGGGGGAGRVRLNSGNANAMPAGTVSPSLTTRCATQGLLRGENAGP